jgi:hypothetical protein
VNRLRSFRYFSYILLTNEKPSWRKPRRVFLGLNIGGDQKSPVSSLKRASSGIEILIFLCLLSARVQTIATPVTAGATLPGLVKTFSATLHPQQLIQKPKYKYLFWSIFVSDDTAIDLAFDL